MTDAVEHHAREAGAAARSSARGGWLRTLGKVGYAAQGVVWLLLGWIALQLALGSGSSEEATQEGALARLAGNGLGRVLLVVMIAGLVAYAVWQAVEAIWGHTHQEQKKRLAKRLGSAGKAVLSLALVATAIGLLSGSGGDSGGSPEQATSGVLGVPGGFALVVAAGLALLVLGAYLVYRGVTASFREKLEPGVDRRVIAAGRVGYAGRGVAVAVVGVLLVLAAARHDPEQAGGLDAAFTALLQLPLGAVVLGAVALALMFCGVYQVVVARHLVEG
ncbi:DUF1206 domain-containing protein [Georgenia yuyongxinii]|uniref:DUF1206 domain-containing protein n=1 Tax=Georgenia yuyongxinii TaxID=2589797 RepID=A0A5B8C1U5_9MICO|nr:DUF1206 domain-containing protein [Georgenia yuyongxinii]QDC24649.1 DUF1206 domain-containing protein [Georgenia yuyongxinii]